MELLVLRCNGCNSFLEKTEHNGVIDEETKEPITYYSYCCRNDACNNPTYTLPCTTNEKLIEDLKNRYPSMFNNHEEKNEENVNE